MKHQKFYMHNKSKDVFIQILHATKTEHGSFNLVVRFWNLGFTGNPWSIAVTDIFIKKRHLSNWKEINPTEDWKAIRDNQRRLNELQ